MTNEEALRLRIETLERQHLEFAEMVRREAQRLAAKCSVNPTTAALAALDVCQRAADEKHRILMQQEASGEYDLALLRVDADRPSNSETPYEDD